jgi:hypothetical protein
MSEGSGERGHIVPLSDEERRAITDVLEPRLSQLARESGTTDAAARSVIGIYVDPPGVCIAVEA